MIFTIFVVLFSLALFLDYMKRKRRNDMISTVPGPMTVPFIGTFLIFFATNVKASIKMMQDASKLFNGIFRAWVFYDLVLVIVRPDYLETVLNSTKNIKKNILYNHLNVWLGQGLLLSSGSKWHSRRKVITPAFHFKILEQFVEVFDRQSSVLVDRLKKHADDKEAFNVFPYITLAALDVISETAMGVKVNAQTDSNCEYVRAVSDISEIMMLRLANPFYQSNLAFRLLAPGRKRLHDKSLKVLHSFTRKVIEQRRDMLEQKLAIGNENDYQEDNIGIRKKMAFLDILLQSTVNGSPLSNADIQEEVDTFMFEGHDTTTSGISFTLYQISRHPEVQQKLFDEIRQVLGTDKNKPVDYNDLQELKYMERVIKESLRLFPPVPIIGREFTEEVEIGGHRIPVETELIIPLFIMMKDPKYFPDPEKFDPDRHLLENSTEKTNPYVYVPFSAGPRNCIGQKFAMLEMKSFITKILRHYELLPLGDVPEPELNIVMKSSNGVHIGIRLRVY